MYLLLVYYKIKKYQPSAGEKSPDYSELMGGEAVNFRNQFSLSLEE